MPDTELNLMLDRARCEIASSEQFIDSQEHLALLQGYADNRAPGATVVWGSYSCSEQGPLDGRPVGQGRPLIVEATHVTSSDCGRALMRRDERAAPSGAAVSTLFVATTDAGRPSRTGARPR